MSRFAIPFTVLLVVVALRGWVVPLHAQSGPVVSLEPANVSLAAGEEQTLEVRIAGGQDLGGFQFDLLFPPGSISLSQATLGPLLASTGRSALPLGPTSKPGRVSFGGFTFGDAAGASGDGVLAVLIVRGETPGRGELRLERVQVLDVRGNDLKPTAGGPGTLEVTGSGPAPTVTPGPPTPTIAIAEAPAPPPGPPQVGGGEGRVGTPGWLVPALAVVGALLVGVGLWQATRRRQAGPPANSE